MKIKHIFRIVLCVTSLNTTLLSSALGAGDWKLHPTFENKIAGVIDTPALAYFLCYGQLYNTSFVEYASPYITLFAYDKKSDELLSYNGRNYLSATILNRADYNAKKNYLLLIYSDWNIDLLYDDGSVVNLPQLKNATLDVPKNVRAVSFDADHNLAYIGTDFGYIVIDDEKNQIADSRRLGNSVTAIARVGDSLYLTTGGANYSAPAENHFMSLAEYSTVPEISFSPTAMFPIGDKQFCISAADRMYLANIGDSGTISVSTLFTGKPMTVQQNRDGFFVNTTSALWQIKYDGTAESVKPTDAPADASGYYGSWDSKEYWYAKGRKGLRSQKYADGVWTLTRDFMWPNAPTAFQCQDFAFSDKYGLFATNHGVNRQFTSSSMDYDARTAAINNGIWKTYSSIIISSRGAAIVDPYGIVFDPDNDKYYWQGSYKTGLVRFNVEDPDDIQVFGNKGQKYTSTYPGFHEVAPADSWYSYFGAPGFDADGNLWTCHQSTQYAADGDKRLWCFPRTARAALDPNGFIKLPTPGFSWEYASIMKPLKHPDNKNLIVMSQGTYGGKMAILDHKGTLDNPDDDEIIILGTLYDESGTDISRLYTFDFYEDMETGLVWVGHSNGVFTMNPRKMFQTQTVSRKKVSRNDGTSMADYLLDGINVYRITSDSQNRKWFATSGAGIVWSSADGTQVLKQLTTDNSYLPSDVVYGIGYNPASNSVMAGTSFGLAEYFLPGSAISGEYADQLTIYPNPVRPDYLGWITIDGLIDGSLVKIVDSAGNIVKELGICEGGTAQWDGYTLNNTRAHTGVYYIVASEGPNGASAARIGKVLIVN